MLAARKPTGGVGSLEAEGMQQQVPPEGGIEPQLDAASTTASLLRGILDRLRHVEAENAELRSEVRELRNPAPATSNNAEGTMQESTGTIGVLMQRIEMLERAAEHSSEEARAARGAAADEARAELRPLLDAARRAAEESAAGAATVSGAIENDVAALRVALSTERAEAEAFRQKEQEKSALLFGEVVRVSNASRETDTSSSETARAMAARVESLEARAVTLERALAIADERTGREGAEGELRAGQLGVQIGDLQAQFESLRADVRAADLARERAAGEQGQWGKRLHEALARVDVSAAERVAQALVAVDGRVAQDKTELGARLEALQNELRNSTAAARDAHEASASVMVSRLAALEAALNNEQQQRSTQQGVDRREAEGSVSDLAARFNEERQERTTAITSLERQLIEGLEAARQSGQTTSDRLSTRLDQLEEVLRAEVQSRLKGQKQARDTQEAAAEASTRAIAAIAQESSEAVREVRDELTTQSQKQAESLEKEAESLKKISAEHSRAQAVLQGDLSARLAVVEAAERHADEARSSLQGELSKRLEQYRGSADEMIESLSRRITAQREVLDAAIERVRVAATAEVRASEKTLAEGTTRATAVLRAEMAASEQQQSRATAAVAAEGREGRLHVAARIAAAETAQAAARRSTEVERALCAMVDEIADRNSAMTLTDAASALSGEAQRIMVEVEQRADAEARERAEAVATCEARAEKAARTSTECVTSLSELSSLLVTEREQRRHERTIDAKEAAEARAKLADDAQTALAALEARADTMDVAMTVESIVSHAIELEALLEPVASLQVDLATQQRESRATFDAVQSAAQQERNYARELRGRIEGVASGLDEQREHRRRAREQNEAFARALEADARKQ